MISADGLNDPNLMLLNKNGQISSADVISLLFYLITSVIILNYLFSAVKL